MPASLIQFLQKFLGLLGSLRLWKFRDDIIEPAPGLLGLAVTEEDLGEIQLAGGVFFRLVRIVLALVRGIVLFLGGFLVLRFGVVLVLGFALGLILLGGLGVRLFRRRIRLLDAKAALVGTV